MIRYLLAHAIFAAVVGGAQLALAAAAPAPPSVRRDARELLPLAFIGSWQIDLAASTYPVGQTPPKSHFRFFDFTEDAKVLVTFMTLNANGSQSVGHWAVQLDGTVGTEYLRANGPVPDSLMVYHKIDEQTITMTVSRYGVVTQQAMFRVSPDGQTLTYSQPTTPNTSVVVYKRWDMAY